MKIFLPLLDNGSGQVMASFMMDHVAAFKGRDIKMVRAGDSHADRGMNKIANAFLDSDCDVWVNIDADIRFRKMDVDNLLSHVEQAAGEGRVPLQLVYGIYPKKEDATTPCLCTFAEVRDPDPESGLTEVRRCGRGFMAVRRELLEAMKEDNGGPAERYHNHGKVEWSFFKSGSVTGEFSIYDNDFDEDGFPKREWLSEDWMFCERARKLGVKTLVDTRIALGHVGAKEYRFSFAAGQVDRVDGWHGIPGWFTDADAEVYRIIAKEIPSDAVVAEVGTWMGRSLGAFMTFCKELDKHPIVHSIDTFKGTESEGDAHAGIVAAHGGSVRAVFESNMEKIGANGDLFIHEADSLHAAEEFYDSSLDAIFIDGDHTEEAVSADINAWFPKLRQGGIIAGHDFDYPEVQTAVRRYFGVKARAIGRCWVVRT